ncbi:aldo/keto reductase [Promicromonospora sp. NPDC090134]|uniref:aldo/keto reductase n=1 Tax=Promicromonospora sp. NPDC090134 TaxID=3364408 RepID=UPI0038026E26
MVTAVENSLRRLQTDHLDLYQVHRPDPATDVEETLSALSDLIRSGPLAQGLLTGRIRKGGQNSTHRSDLMPGHFDHERKLDVVEQIVPLAEQAGLPMTHLTLAFAVAHPGVTSAIIGPRTMEQLDDLLAGADVTLDDEILDRIDAIAPPGTDMGGNDVAYTPQAVSSVDLRRRPVAQRSAA